MDERDYDPEYDPRMADTGPVRRSGAVTAVAVINFVVGGLLMASGPATMIVGPEVIAQILLSVDTKDMTPENVRQIKEIAANKDGVLTIVAGIFGGCFMAVGLPAIIAGVGVVKRRPWGRILTIVLGSLSILFAVLNLLSLNIIGVAINVGYTVVVFVILLNSRYAAEFR